MPPRTEKRLLDDVFRVVERAEHAVAVHVQRLAMVLDLLGKGGLVVGSEHRDQRRFLINHACGDLKSLLTKV